MDTVQECFPIFPVHVGMTLPVIPNRIRDDPVVTQATQNQVAYHKNMWYSNYIRLRVSLSRPV